MQPRPECRDGVAGRLALIVGDGRDPDLAGTDEEVAVIGQITAAGLDDLHRQVEARVHEVLGRPLGQKGVRAGS